MELQHRYKLRCKNMKLKATVIKTGNSYGFRVPKSIIEALDLKKGDVCYIDIKNSTTGKTIEIETFKD